MNKLEKELIKLQKPQVGDYLLGKTIGEGTFGKVKLGTHIPTGEKVRLKTFDYNFLLGCNQTASEKEVS